MADTRVLGAERAFDRPDWREEYGKDGGVTREVGDAMSITPENALFTAAGYDHGLDDEFLARLRRDLYPAESYPATSWI